MNSTIYWFSNYSYAHIITIITNSELNFGFNTQCNLQYVALRNINLVVQKRPDILKHEIKAFFVKYNDPIYVKLEKLDIMIRLAAQTNIAQGIKTL